MRRFLIILFLGALGASAQPDGPNRHIVSLKQNCSAGFLSSYFEHHYSANVFGFPHATELGYSYFVNGNFSLHAGLNIGKYENNYYPTDKHTMEFVGVKLGGGFQVSRDLGKSVVKYMLCFYPTSHVLTAFIPDPYSGWSYYTKEFRENYTYWYAEIGMLHQLPLAMKGKLKAIFNYGLYITPYVNDPVFYEYRQKVQVEPAIPGIGNWNLLVPYVSTGIGYGF